jgi:hypothetical protein
MTSFSIDLPADPRWLHVARASALAGLSAMPTAHVDFLDDAMLAVGESVLEVAVVPGVERLKVRIVTSAERVDVEVEGAGDEIDTDDAGRGVFALILEGLAGDLAAETTATSYTVRFGMPAP